MPGRWRSRLEGLRRIRLSGQGEAGPSGTVPGDLYVEVRVREHAIFQREGDDLHCEMPVSITTA